MNCHVLSPKSALGNAVDYIYLQKAASFEANATTAPLLHQEMVFNLGDWFEVKDFAGRFSTGSYKTWLTGLQTGPTKTITKGQLWSVGILFKPWGLYQVLGIPPAGLANQAREAGQFQLTLLDEVVRDKASNRKPEDLLVYLENFLLRNFPLRPVRKEVIDSIDTINAADSQRGTIRKLASELDITPKTFIGAFNQTVGLSPVQYLHLKRINLALQSLRQHPDKPLTELGLELGFYDQAHFTRVFKSFCQETPKDYRNRIIPGR